MLGAGRSRANPREVRLPSKGEHHVCLRLTKRKERQWGWKERGTQEQKKRVKQGGSEER